MVELVRSLMYNQRHDTTDVSEKFSILTVFGNVFKTPIRGNGFIDLFANT